LSLIGRFGFPRTRRLLNRSEFGRVFDGHCKVANESFTVYAITNDYDQPRLGLVVGKKVSRRAVDRNRIKRVIREAFRQLAPEMAKLDIVVLARAAAITQSGSSLITQLTNLLGRVETKCAKASPN